ncbi:hypothetical protein HYH03_016723 [Edaphochlamys debaryana]|uniref:Adaptor protein ClpS core domain-containing protein n=1 Tax=Edaphochlamys debaryana TaxID=47281 RepID=A0A836BR70_9CHLO|nr:hypothetical protein HYH03_016723 [Edaphochlamys debaryana]|eukprot:KAG2484494.1 hypothetical protein HYH03_016723 [Edaphochlamys debaryana]
MLQARVSAPSRVACRSAGRSRVRCFVAARFGGGGNVIDRPSDVDVSKRLGGFDLSDWGSSWTPTPEAGRNGSGIDKQKNSPPGGGNYRVLLVDNTQHSEKGVTRAICSVIPGADESHAKNCYATSKQLGMALVTTALKEHAEFYREQLYQYGCRTVIEPDSTTV